jgi:hypothetical protein
MEKLVYGLIYLFLSSLGCIFGKITNTTQKAREGLVKAKSSFPFD